MTEELKKKWVKLQLRAAKAVNYKNAGTIEFLLDKHGKYYLWK